MKKSLRSIIAPPLRTTTGLLAAMLILAMPFRSLADTGLKVSIIHIGTGYYAGASLVATNPPPDTYHRVESPTGEISRNIGSSYSSDSSPYTNSLDAVVGWITNGNWSLKLNVGATNEQEYAFSVDASGLDTNVFADTAIISPLYFDTVSTNQPEIIWSGPNQFPEVSIEAYEGDGPFSFTYLTDATLPGATTNWTVDVPMAAGLALVQINYESNNLPGVTFSVPTNLIGGATLSGWSAGLTAQNRDSVEFTVPGAAGDSALGEAVDAPQFAWTTGSDSGGGGWFAQDYEYDTGTNAAQSGLVSDFEASWIETTIQGPGYLEFYWNMYADADDYFELTVSNLYGEYGEFSAQGDEADGWQWNEVYLDPGPNTLRWTFYNDGLDANDLDAAFLDGVLFYPEDAYYEADFELWIQRVTDGASSYYLLFPSLPYSAPFPFTVNEVVSPNELASGDEFPSSSIQFSTLQDAIDEIEAGPWTIYFDRYGPTVEYYFTIDASALNTNDLPPAIVLDPADGATGVATNTTFLWLGPTSYDSLYIYARDVEANSTLGGASLPVSSTTWPAAPVLPLGTNSFNATYTSNNYEGLLISYPEDESSYPLDNWNTQVQLETRASSTFVTGIGGFIPLPVTLLPPMMIAGDFGLSFISQSGATHWVEYTTNLVTGPWMPATNFPGDGTTNLFMAPATNPAAYFRIETQ